MTEKRLTLPLKDQTQFEIPEDLMRELHENYFGVDQELRRMRIWLMANPLRRKTRRGIRRFIVNWLNRARLLRPQGRPLSLVRVTSSRPLTDEQRQAGRTRLAGIKAMIKAC